MTSDEFIAAFKYEADGKIDSYHLIDKPPYAGDCDDFARTLARLEAGSALRDWFDIWTLKSSFHCVNTAGGNHVVLHRYGKGYIDNIDRNWRKDIGFQRRFPYLRQPIVVTIKILIGKILP